MMTLYKILVFIIKITLKKIMHYRGLSLHSMHSLKSRCRWSTEFVIKGKSHLKLGIIECASYTRLAAVAGGNISIGDHCYFNRNCTVISRKSILIGKNCTFGPNICIYDHDHEIGKEGQTGRFKLGRIEIGDNCWFGAGAMIMKDTVIGKNCVIGAGCIVKGVIPDNSIVSMNRELHIKPLHD